MLGRQEMEEALQQPDIESALTQEQRDHISARKRKEASVARAAKALSDHDAACPHFLVHDSDYYSGSYYDRASTTHYHLCLICGHRTKVKEETHNWYG